MHGILFVDNLINKKSADRVQTDKWLKLDNDFITFFLPTENAALL